MHNAEQMSAHSKEILHGAVHREKPLRVRGGLETPHLAFPLPGWLVRGCGPVVRVPVRAVDHGRHHGAAGRGVAAECVGDQSPRVRTDIRDETGRIRPGSELELSPEP